MTQLRNRGVSAGIRRVPCPESTRIQRGQQCPRCTARDEFTALHSAPVPRNTHRIYARLRHAGASPHRDLPRRHALGRHELPTFDPAPPGRAGGRHRHHIALAPDGLAIRRAEDAVTALAKIPQVKQVASKYRAWTNPLPGAQLRPPTRRQSPALAKRSPNWRAPSWRCRSRPG